MDLTDIRGARRAVIAALWVCLCIEATAAPVAFDVPPQSVATAVVTFAKQAGIEVLFSYRELNAVRSIGVAGRLEPDVALTQLLVGTGFVATRNASGKYTIVRAPRQVGTIYGVIVAEAGGAPVSGARIQLDGTGWTVRVGADGRFVFTDVPPGPEALVVQADGYRSLRLTGIYVDVGRLIDVGSVRLAMGADDPQRLSEIVVKAEGGGDGSMPVALDAVVVTPSRYLMSEERGTVAATLTETDLLALPQLGEDLYRAISHLPGLAADDFTAKFWVRGAPYDKMLARLDGADLIEPFHLKDVDSTLSILDLEAIARMDLYTGGFTADYGGALAGVLTMETDRYVRPKPRTTLAVSLTGIRAATRGASRDGRQHWLLAGRTGYPALAVGITDGDNVIKPHYHDVYGKWEIDLTPQHALSIHTLHAHDAMSFRDETGPLVTSHYGSDYVWARWRGSFTASLEAETVVAGTKLNWHRTGSGIRNGFYAVALEDDRDLTRGSFRQDWTAKLSERAMLRAGVGATTGRAAYDYAAMHEEPTVANGVVVTEPVRRSGRAAPAGSTWGTYLSARVQPLPSLTLEAGGRYDRTDYAADTEITPRLNVAWTKGRTILRGAWGEYGQAEGLHELALGDGETAFHRSERAEQRVIGVERRLGSGINVRLEAYDRRVSRPRPHWENVVDALDVLGELSYDRVKIDPVRQRASGLELIAEQRSNARFTWSASYALARSQETLRDGGIVWRARDQRHTIYLDASYSPNERWQLSAAWQYHTGWPATPVNFVAAPLANGAAAVFGHPGPIYSIRLPDYHRLDVRVQRRLRLKHGDLRLYLDVFNAYSHRNSLGYRYSVTVHGSDIAAVVRETDHNLFPLLPSVGAVWDF